MQQGGKRMIFVRKTYRTTWILHVVIDRNFIWKDAQFKNIEVAWEESSKSHVGGVCTSEQKRMEFHSFSDRVGKYWDCFWHRFWADCLMNCWSVFVPICGSFLWIGKIVVFEWFWEGFEKPREGVVFGSSEAAGTRGRQVDPTRIFINRFCDGSVLLNRPNPRPP